MTNENTNETTMTGFCDVCGARETASADALLREGWHLGSREHFCPNCND
jgi:hypothetical protein